MYLLLQEKCKTTYKNMNYNLKNTFINSEEKFYNLKLKDKANVISESLKLLDVSALIPNFQDIDSFTGSRILISNNVLNKKIYIHNESITGVFENKIRIK